MMKLPFELLLSHVATASNVLPSGPESESVGQATQAIKGAHAMDDIDYEAMHRALQDRNDQTIAM